MLGSVYPILKRASGIYHVLQLLKKRHTNVWVMTNKTVEEAPMGKLATDESPVTPRGLTDTRVRVEWGNRKGSRKESTLVFQHKLMNALAEQSPMEMQSEL